MGSGLTPIRLEKSQGLHYRRALEGARKIWAYHAAPLQLLAGARPFAAYRMDRLSAAGGAISIRRGAGGVDGGKRSVSGSCRMQPVEPQSSIETPVELRQPKTAWYQKL